MTIRHIKIFEAVCECGCNMTKAAECLHMTQPAVSLAVSELESYYGVKLFDRIARRLYLSDAGRTFREYAKTITLTFDDMEKTVRDWDARGIIRVGASISIGSMLLPGYVKSFRETHPDTTVKVKINRSDRLEQALSDNSIDFALIEGVVHDPALVCEDYMEDRLAVIVSPETCANGSVLEVSEFSAMPFLLREHGSGTREIFEAAMQAKSIPLPEPLWESLSTAALMNAAEAGIGAAVVPWRMAAERIASGTVSEVFAQGIDFSRKYKIVYHRDKKLTGAALDFLELCRTAESRENPDENAEPY
ncbi:MAG: LysR family transcriptional regulator [Clostridia bacterium]|nr:LysR family transcriptional regulator [Clostridia bacterium]